MPVRLCKYSGCAMPIKTESVVDILAAQHNLCSHCYNKVLRFEKALDLWLEAHHPNLFLEDLLGWYTMCINNPCQRDCLEVTYPSIPGCLCCPHLQYQTYHRYRIDRMLMPTEEWLQENVTHTES